MKRGRGRKLIETRPTFSLAPTPTMIFKQESNTFWEYHLLDNMRNTWGYRLLWVEQRDKILFISRKEYERGFKDGRKNSYHKQGERC